MEPVAAVFPFTGGPGELQSLDSLRQCEAVGEVALVLTPGAAEPPAGLPIIHASNLWSTATVVQILDWFAGTGARSLLWVLSPATRFHPDGLKRLVDPSTDAGAALAYGDYFDRKDDGSVHLHPLIDYQPGSLRDDFDFGPMVLLEGTVLSGVARSMEGLGEGWTYGGWYDLRLRLSERGPVVHLSEPVCEVPVKKKRPTGQKVFDYVDPRNRDYQLEMEQVATAHLERIGALLPPPTGYPSDAGREYPVKASVVIPVKNRLRTIGDAVHSALSQKTSFEFNVIVVDNHSNDGTSDYLDGIREQDERLVHQIPQRKDLAIGGCWNHAIYSEACGRYAVQLDSDDLYDGTMVLQRIVDEFDRHHYAMVIGSYSTVNFDREPLPPGLVDHAEWTDTNGHNNALRIAGLGAPRAFHVPTLRSIGFPNVSYGEDYAVALRLCRTYPVGRIFDSLYLCRRWEENSDSALSLEVKNRYDAYKDRIRTLEIAARQKQDAPGT